MVNSDYLPLDCSCRADYPVNSHLSVRRNSCRVLVFVLFLFDLNLYRKFAFVMTVMMFGHRFVRFLWQLIYEELKH